ncbi:hypothetical protein HWV62_29531 [Athelia sp. TMB]|nr:hypothetical protein HWV62_29531 [Athelia sp. TMB]
MEAAGPDIDIASLEPQIRAILTAPGTDLARISAKAVRTQLVGARAGLTAAHMKAHKQAFDAVIGRVFEAVSAERAAASLSTASTSEPADEDEEGDENFDGEEERDDEDEEEEEAEEEARPAKKARKGGAKPAKGTGVSDAELARQLSSEINGRPTRSAGAGAGGAKKKARPRAKKSAEMVVDSDSDASGSPKKRKRKASSAGAGGGVAKGGFAKEYALSAPLAALLSVPTLSRPQVVKQLWVYIKGHELQNPANKREILCDDALRDVFGCDKIDMFRMNKVLGACVFLLLLIVGEAVADDRAGTCTKMKNRTLRGRVGPSCNLFTPIFISVVSVLLWNAFWWKLVGCMYVYAGSCVCNGTSSCGITISLIVLANDDKTTRP